MSPRSLVSPADRRVASLALALVGVASLAALEQRRWPAVETVTYPLAPVDG